MVLSYKSLLRSVLTYACETWFMSRTDEIMINIYERKNLRFIFGGIQENGTYRRRSNFKLYQSYNERERERESLTLLTSSNNNEFNGQVMLSEWTRTAPLKTFSMPNQLVLEERPDQILDGLMA
ncbi:hypothetical protein TNCV_973031 [Trichonephila clavipes]|nr:hypothetical protein TNCV_973031 [Trichonephila clavipes]